LYMQEASPSLQRGRKTTSSSTPKRLPSYIGVNGEQEPVTTTPMTRSPAREELQSGRRRYRYHDTPEGGVDAGRTPIMTPVGQKLDTIMSGVQSLPPQRSATRRSKSSSDSVNSANSTSKLSVAQRARLQADERSSNSVRVKPPPRRGQSESSLLGSIGKSLTEAIDHSVLGLPSSDESSDEFDDTDDERRYSNSETGMSETSGISLQERQAIQRAKQLAFLKEQGLIKNESNLRGGAGATPSPQRRSPSRTSNR